MHERELTLDSEGIDLASEAIAAFLQSETKLDRRSVLSVRLTFENALIRLQEHFGERTPAQLVVGKSLGKPMLRVKVRGERFDPRDEVGISSWERALMETAGLRPLYAYRGGYNIVSISCPRGPMGSTMRATIAVILGLIIAQVGLRFPEQTRIMLLDGLITPVINCFTGMLAGIAGPMVFFSVAWGICGIGDMAALGRSGKALISRFLEMDVLGTILTLLVGMPLFHLSYAPSTTGESGLASITRLLLDILPTNMVKPFVEGNALQIIVLSVVVGVAALALGDLTEGIREILRQLNTLIQFLMEQLCRLLPGLIVVMIVSQAWTGTASTLLKAWMPIIGYGICAVLTVVVMYVVTAMRSHVPLRKLIFPSIGPQVLAFTTASSTAAFGSITSACKDDYGISDEQVSFGVPLGMVLCKPSAAYLVGIVVMYCAYSTNVGADVLWYVRLGISSLLFAIATPPIPGGMLACYSIILANLGIPMETLVLATGLNLLMDNPCTSINVGALMLSVFSAADSLGEVDRSKLVKNESARQAG